MGSISSQSIPHLSICFSKQNTGTGSLVFINKVVLAFVNELHKVQSIKGNSKLYFRLRYG